MNDHEITTLRYSLLPRCRGCHAPLGRLEPIVSMEPMPLAGMFCPTRDAALVAPVFPLTWLHCSRCGLVQVQEDVDDRLLFTKYNYSSSAVQGLVRHFEGYAALLAGRYPAASKLVFLEIGCNDGVLLNRLPANWRLFGCDPSDVAAAAAAGAHYELFPVPFNLAAVETHHLENAVDVISGSNCLAHVSDLREVFEAAWLALRVGGHFWIEVHDLHALLRGRQWDTIYHEHKAEWSEPSLERCLAGVGFACRERFHTPMHGGALRMCFEKLPARGVMPEATLPMDPGFHELRDAYLNRYETKAATVLARTLNNGGRIAAYGASGRANVYLNQMRELKFDYIIDEAPLRLNTFLPQAGTPVVAPDWLTGRPVSACLITAWNYRDDIVRKNPQHQGAWLTAFEAN